MFPLRILASATVVLTLAASAAAQDAKINLEHAMEALNAAPAYRMTVVSTDAATKNVTNIVYESVNPNAVHMRSEEDGKVQMEMLTDGKTTYFRPPGAEKLQVAPPSFTAMMTMARASISPESLLAGATNVKFEGHETVAGVPASVYTCDSGMMGLSASDKVWISDKDGRPLKVEGDLRGEAKMGNHPGHHTDKHSVITYDYDPSIKIVLPSGN